MTCDLIRDIMTNRFTSTCRSVYIHFHTMRSMSRDLFRGQSRFMACYASNKFSFLPKIMTGIVWNASKRMSMQWHAFRCISGIRQIYNFRWSASALADHQKLSVWFVFLAWIEGTLSTRMQLGFSHFFKSCILTESHVTKNDFFLWKKIENFGITFFYSLWRF